MEEVSIQSLSLSSNTAVSISASPCLPAAPTAAASWTVSAQTGDIKVPTSLDQTNSLDQTSSPRSFGFLMFFNGLCMSVLPACTSVCRAHAMKMVHTASCELLYGCWELNLVLWKSSQQVLLTDKSSFQPPVFFLLKYSVLI